VIAYKGDTTTVNLLYIAYGISIRNIKNNAVYLSAKTFINYAD
jgi:hypothetical protein